MTYVLLTRAPLYWGRSPFSRDLHVLGAPLTFVLSQDQTLQFESFGERCEVNRLRYHYALLVRRLTRLLSEAERRASRVVTRTHDDSHRG